MTKNSILVRPLLALAAVLVTAPLAADEGAVVTGERQPVYQQRVSFSDLDLQRWGDQQALRRRVHRASNQVCVEAFGPIGAADTGLAGTRDAGMSCGDLTYREARPQISAAIGRAKSGQLMATNLVIAILARAR